MARKDAELAEAVGRRMLRRGGAELLELLYLMEEKDNLDVLREFAVMSEENKGELLKFVRMANAIDCIHLLAEDSGLVMQRRAAGAAGRRA